MRRREAAQGAKARRGPAARTRRARAGLPTPAGTVTRAAARARGGGGTAATGSSCPRVSARIRSSRRTSSGRP